jgi:hypothetical protein
MNPGYNIRRTRDHGPGWLYHEPPPLVREPVIVRCGMPDCPSALAMPPGTPAASQATRLEVAGWTYRPDGPYVCPVDHGQEQSAAPVSWWRRWFGGVR